MSDADKLLNKKDSNRLKEKRGMYSGLESVPLALKLTTVVQRLNDTV